MMLARHVDRIIGLSMSFLLALLLLLLLPDPWNVAGALAALGLFGLEVLFFYRRMRGAKVRTGAEDLVGTIGTTVEAIDPEGHIRVLGELWQARAGEAIQRGTRVRVVAVDGLTVEVEPAESSAASAPAR